MAHYIKDKHGRFAGSVGDGITPPSQTNLTPSEAEEEMSEEVVSLSSVADELTTENELDEATAYFLSQSDLDTHIETYLTNPSQEMRDRLISRIESEDFLIQREIVKAENMPSELLDHFSRDGSQFADVRMGVALNPNTAPETLTRLAEDEKPMVRRSVADNPNTTIEVLTHLSEDNDEYVRKHAKQALKERSTA